MLTALRTSCVGGVLEDALVARIEGRLPPGAPCRKPVDPAWSTAKAAKICRRKWIDPSCASGPLALLLGNDVVDALLAEGVAEAEALRIGAVVAGCQQRTPGTAARFRYPVLPASTGGWQPLITEPKVLFSGSEPVSKLPPHGMLAVSLPWTGPPEDAPVGGIPLAPSASVAAAVHIAVAADGSFQLAYGDAGAIVAGSKEELRGAIESSRQRLTIAEEFGGEPLPDVVWIQPAPNLPISGLVHVLDLLYPAPNEQLFRTLVIGATGKQVRWPEQLDPDAL